MILLKNRDRNPSFKSGKYVEINDAGNYPMELSIDGVCEQETTSGKNKLPNNATSKTLNGVTFTKNSDGTVVVNGTSTASCFYNIISDNEVPITTTNLILSGCPLGGTSSSYRLRATYTDTSYSEDIGNSIKLKGGKVLQIVTIVITNGTTCNNLTFKPMISSDGGEYEPYTGGQPSPSPDYPQNISVLTGNLKLTSCGKNLFDINSLNFENVWIRSTGEKVAANNNGFLSYAEILPNAEYILSLNRIVSIIGICEYDKNKNFIQRIVTSNSSSKTIITSTTTKYIGVFINIDGVTLVTKDIIKECEPQLEKSNQATPYEPYQSSSLNITIPENEFVGKLDDTYKDTLNVVYKEDGKYHLILNKMVAKVVLNGSENIGKGGVEKDTTQLFIVYGCQGITQGNGEIKSNYFIYNKNAWDNNTESIRDCSKYSANSCWIRIKKERLNDNTVNSFKNWLSTNKPILYYSLETPYVVDLGIVDTLLSYDEITNIFTDSDLYPVINAKYYKDFEFDKILRSGYNIDEQEYEIAKKQMANGKRKRILSSYDDCIIKINLGLLDNKTYQEYKEQLDDGEFHYWSYKYNQYKKANFILTKPSITTEYAYDDDIGIDDIEITLEKSSDVS